MTVLEERIAVEIHTARFQRLTLLIFSVDDVVQKNARIASHCLYNTPVGWGLPILHPNMTLFPTPRDAGQPHCVSVLAYPRV
jgi:hypothetical protein